LRSDVTRSDVTRSDVHAQRRHAQPLRSDVHARSAVVYACGRAAPLAQIIHMTFGTRSVHDRDQRRSTLQ
jgi:hypothetical protein